MVFLIEVAQYHCSDRFLIFDGLEIDHLIFSFQRQTPADRSDREVIALCEFPSERAFSGKDLYLDMVVIYATKLIHIAGINIMQMYTSSALTKLRICGRPHASGFKIPFERLITAFVRNIKVDNDVVLRRLNEMNHRGVQSG